MTFVEDKTLSENLDLLHARVKSLDQKKDKPIQESVREELKTLPLFELLSNLSSDKLKTFVQQANKLPSVQTHRIISDEELNWKLCWPKSCKFHDMLCWWIEWKVLAERVKPLNPTNMLEQFDFIMLKYCESYIKELFLYEAYGEVFSLKQRWAYISHKLKVANLISYHEEELLTLHTSVKCENSDTVDHKCKNCGTIEDINDYFDNVRINKFLEYKRNREKRNKPFNSTSMEKNVHM